MSRVDPKIVAIAASCLCVLAPAMALADEEIKASLAVEGSGTDGESEAEEIPPQERSPIDGVMGHIGIGYFTDFAPLGVRYWLGRNFAIDVGLDGSFSSGSLDGYSFGLEVGGVLALAHYHYAVAITRVGLGWHVNDTTGEHSTGAEHQVNLSGFLGVELFLGALGFPNVSLQGGYGLQARWVVSGGTDFVVGVDSAPSLSVVNAGVFGFHIYL